MSENPSFRTTCGNKCEGQMERTFIQFIKKPFHSAMVLGPHQETLTHRALSNKHTTIRHLSLESCTTHSGQRGSVLICQKGVYQVLSTNINPMAKGKQRLCRTQFICCHPANPGALVCLWVLCRHWDYSSKQDTAGLTLDIYILVGGSCQ